MPTQRVFKCATSEAPCATTDATATRLQQATCNFGSGLCSRESGLPKIAIPVDDDAYDVPLPDGLLRRGRISYSDSTLPADTALRHIWWVNGDFSAHKIDLRDQLGRRGRPDC